MVGFKGAGCDLIVFGTIIRDTIVQAMPLPENWVLPLM